MLFTNDSDKEKDLLDYKFNLSLKKILFVLLVVFVLVLFQ